MKNKILAGIMAVYIIGGVGVIPESIAPAVSMTASAVDTYEGFTYKIGNDDTITITGFDDSVAEVEIPSEIDGKKVTAIGNRAFYQSKSLVSVSIPDGVVSIGSSVFYECKKLASISIPDSVNEMGGYCFYGCTRLESARLSEGLTELPDKTFYNCSLLSKLVIPDNIQTIRVEACYGCKNLKSVSLGKYLEKINDNAFWGCISLTSITIPEYVTYIGYYAFNNCDNLNELIIMNPVCSIAGWNNLPSTCTIYGYEGSTAQKYAEKGNIEFVALDSVQSSTTTTTTTTTSDTTESKKTGDANGDGKVTIADAVLVMQSLANPNEYKLTEQQILNADVVDRGDGLTAKDALAMQMVDIQIITEEDLPITSAQIEELIG